MNKAIVICYTGRPIEPEAVSAIQQVITSSCDAMPELITVKAFDEDSIAKALLKKSAEDLKISFAEDHNTENKQQQKVETVKVCFDHGPTKLQVIKFIKETFDVPLKYAKDAVDNGIIMVPRTTDVYQFVRDLYVRGGCIIDGGDEQYTVAQAAVFINSRYPGIMQIENLVKDFAMAKYHDTVNATDDTEKALLNTVRIVKEYPDLIRDWIGSDKVKAITML